MLGSKAERGVWEIPQENSVVKPEYLAAICSAQKEFLELALDAVIYIYVYVYIYVNVNILQKSLA